MFWARNRRVMSFGDRVRGYMLVARELLRATRSGAGRYRMAILFGLGVAAMAVGGAAVWRTLRTSEHFLLQRVDVSGASRLSSEEVAAACGLEVGKTNVLLESEHAIRERCETHLGIRRAQVELYPPDSVVVRVEEQVPVMYAATQWGLVAVNRYAEAYAPADLMDLQGLPILLATDGQDTVKVLREALALLRTIEAPQSPWAGQGIVMEFDHDIGFSVYAAGKNPRCHFGWGPFPRKLDRVIAALDVAAQRSLDVEEVLADNKARPNEVILKVNSLGAGLASAHHWEEP